MRDRIKDILLENIRINEDLMRNSLDTVLAAGEAVVAALKRGGKVIICGNGGSASDSQHIAAELVGRFMKDRQALPAIALTTNTSIITALANDFGYDIVFARQVEALGQKNDILIGISTSGKAKNVAAAFKQAKKMGIRTLALTGGDGGDLVKLADLSIIIPAKVTARIQEAHITVAHTICEIVEQELC